MQNGERLITSSKRSKANHENKFRTRRALDVRSRRLRGLLRDILGVAVFMKSTTYIPASIKRIIQNDTLAQSVYSTALQSPQMEYQSFLEMCIIEMFIRREQEFQALVDAESRRPVVCILEKPL